MPRHFHEITLNAFVQATEDRSKVIASIENLLGEPVGDRLDEFNVEGQHNNPITNLKVSVKREREIRTILSRWVVEDFWKSALLDLDSRLDDEQVFHFRVDKEAAYEGNVRLWKGGEIIGVKLKIATYPASREKALGMIETLPRILRS